VKQEVELTARTYEQIFEGMSVETGSRADYRRSQGIESEPELIPSDARAALAASDGTDSDALDVEIIEDDGRPIHTGRRRTWLCVRLRGSAITVRDTAATGNGADDA
jgi:hypothetical protein